MSQLRLILWAFFLKKKLYNGSNARCIVELVISLPFSIFSELNSIQFKQIIDQMKSVN